jgi:hypothetical protein
MRRLFSVLLLVTFSFTIVLAQKKVDSPNPVKTVPPEAKQDASAARLPVKRVVLYKNGVGYFEHSTRVHGTQDLSIDFTSAQLNDVLKSLTAVDLGDGRISGVRYNSVAPLDERLKALRLPFGEQLTRAEFLQAMRGARVEVHSGAASASGRLLSVEQEKRPTGKGDLYDVTVFSIMGDGGEMRNFELGPGISVRLAERELNDEVGRYLNLVGSSRAHDLRRMTISATGSGDREIFVSYISEVPVWKSTYRIILPVKAGEKPLLQGWAIVDNTVGEDWKDVQLSLVAGAPQSFIEDISQPYYVRRPVVELPKSAMLAPQAHEGTVTTENVEASGAAAPVETESASVSDMITDKKISNLPSKGRNVASLLSLSPGVANTASAIEKQMVEAASKATGDMFEYDLKQKITIGKNQSALVPILQARIEAEKVSLWNEDSKEIRRALWITNSSGLTLDSGTFNILDANTFAGEGLIETVHPAERRLISYAADPALRITIESEASEKPATHIRIAKGTMVLTREQRDHRAYTLHNSDTTPRQVVIEHPAREGWKLAEGIKPEETTSSFLRFRVAVGPGQTEKLNVEEYHPELTTYELSNLDDDQITIITQQYQPSPAMQEVFRKVLAQKNVVGKYESQVTVRQTELDAITKDQSRLRENMKALKGSAEEKALLQRYTRQLDSQEDRLSVLNKEIPELDGKKDQAQTELDDMLQKIVLDEDF